MRSHTPESNRALASAERAHQAFHCAAASIEAARCRLLYDVRLLALDAPLQKFVASVEQRCMKGGSLGDLLSELKEQALSNPAESLDS